MKDLDLLNTDGVLCVLSAAVPDQVGAVDPVDQFRLCLEPLHGPREPAARQPQGAVKDESKRH